MDLAESDPDALSSSLVLNYKETPQRDPRGKQLVGPEGKALPPLWTPTKLFASDIVDTGDAVDGLLSVDALPDAELWAGVRLLDGAFAGQSAEVIRTRCLAWLEKYLACRFEQDWAETPRLDLAREKIERMNMAILKFDTKGAPKVASAT